MTENLLQKLEEKMMALLTEVEDLRNEVLRLTHENTSIKLDKQNYTKKLQDLVSLLDAVNTPEKAAVNLVAVESVALQA